MTSVTFTPASVNSKALAPLHRHEKRLKSCMCYKIIYYSARERNWTFHVECDMSSTSQRRVLYTSHETKVQFRTLLLHTIFFKTQIKKESVLSL